MAMAAGADLHPLLPVVARVLVQDEPLLVHGRVLLVPEVPGPGAVIVVAVHPSVDGGAQAERRLTAGNVEYLSYVLPRDSIFTSLEFAEQTTGLTLHHGDALA